MLTYRPFHAVDVFNMIDCPVCGGNEFVHRGIGGGVWCGTCEAHFSLRPMSDSGCVVDVTIEHLGGKYLAATEEAKMWVGEQYNYENHRRPGMYFYQVMRGDGLGGENSGWIRSSTSGGVYPAVWEYFRGPLFKENE